MEAKRSRTFVARDDGAGWVMALLFGAFLLVSIGGAFARYQSGGAGAVLGVVPYVLGLFGLLLAMAVIREYRKCVVITCDPGAIAWRDWFSKNSLLVPDIAACSVRWWSVRSTTAFRLVFALRNGATRHTPALAWSQYPRLVAELKRRYAFPVTYDPPRDR